MTADVHKIKNWIEGIDRYKLSGKGTTRLALSDEEMKARDYVCGEMRKLGLEVSIDAVGNICGRYRGMDSSLASVWTGSHIDTVIEGGKFDGMAGVVAGMEAVRMIQENCLEIRRDICVMVYTSEESARFQMGCIGSRALSGHLKSKKLPGILDMNGISLKDTLVDRGYYRDNFDELAIQKGEIYAAVELHIEQSPNLEKNHKKIGIVDAICAPSNFMLEIEGKQSHAGGTSMADRSDAFMTAADIALALEQCAVNGTSPYTTGTVGYVDVSPNAVNVIPGMVIMSIDIRDCDFESKSFVTHELFSRIDAIKRKRRVNLSIREKSNDYPMQCDAGIVALLEEECKKLKLDYMHTISGAYHDSLFIGELAPVAMIFVPSKNGISHSPEEWTDFEDIAAGTSLLASALYRLANQL